MRTALRACERTRRVCIMREGAMPSPIMLLVLASTCLVCRLQLLKGPSQTSEERALKIVNSACIFYGKALRRSSLDFFKFNGETDGTLIP